MSINTNDLVIEKGIWTTIPILGTRTIIEKIEGSEVRYRFGVGGDSKGLILRDTIVVDTPIEVISKNGTSKLTVASGD